MGWHATWGLWPPSPDCWGFDGMVDELLASVPDHLYWR